MDTNIEQQLRELAARRRDTAQQESITGDQHIQMVLYHEPTRQEFTEQIDQVMKRDAMAQFAQHGRPTLDPNKVKRILLVTVDLENEVGAGIYSDKALSKLEAIQWMDKSGRLSEPALVEALRLQGMTLEQYRALGEI